MSADQLTHGEVTELADWLLFTGNAPKLTDVPAFESANFDALVAVIENPEHRRLTERWIDIALKAGFCPRCADVDVRDFALGQECAICGRIENPNRAQIAEANADDDYDRMRDERDNAEAACG